MRMKHREQQAGEQQDTTGQGLSGQKIIEASGELVLTPPLQNFHSHGSRLVDMTDAEREEWFIGMIRFVLHDDAVVSG